MDLSLTPAELFAQLIGYGLSSSLAVLLAALAWQSPDAGRQARALNAACAAVWSLAGLTRFSLLAAGVPTQSMILGWTSSLTFGAAAVWPVCLLLYWNSVTTPAPPARRAGWLLAAAGVAALLLTCCLLAATLYWPEWLTQLRFLVGYNALVVLFCGILILRPRINSGVERVAVALVPLGPLLSLVAHWLQGAEVPKSWLPALEVLTKQSILLTMLGALIYLGRFQASDRFAKLGLRVVWSWILGVALAWIVSRQPDSGPTLRSASEAVGAAVISAGIAMTILLYGWLAAVSDRWVDRRIFGRRDPQAALAELRDRLGSQGEEVGILATAREFIRETVGIDVRLDARGNPPGNDASFPVLVGDREPHVLSPAPVARRRLLLTGEVEFIRQAAQLAGRRLEALEREQERMELSKRQDRLMHQLVDAELRALRAQINPHFLFNSLNTIAAQVHQDPDIAEAMTLRLARIFRYVLSQTERSFSPLREEIDFLRAYLDIEQMRFGERLRVEFRVAESLCDRPVPSLILQPLVENAIKHGFAPKLGECRLLIGGDAIGRQLVLSVEDNGVGAPMAGARPAPGVGLRNVQERLATVYGNLAYLSFDSRRQRGSRATMYLPLDFPLPATA